MKNTIENLVINTLSWGAAYATVSVLTGGLYMVLKYVH